MSLSKIMSFENLPHLLDLIFHFSNCSSSVVVIINYFTFRCEMNKNGLCPTISSLINFLAEVSVLNFVVGVEGCYYTKSFCHPLFVSKWWTHVSPMLLTISGWVSFISIKFQMICDIIKWSPPMDVCHILGTQWADIAKIERIMSDWNGKAMAYI